jgi:hypothetical protein
MLFVNLIFKISLFSKLTLCHLISTNGLRLPKGDDFGSPISLNTPDEKYLVISDTA